MALMLDYIDYLSKEIGARPAGTEEEQQAALYIAEQFQKEASFPATIEEFTSSSNLEGANAILAVITFVVSILAMIFDVLTIPAFVLAAVAAAVYTLEALDMNFVSKALSRGASQNVVAKYQPFPGAASKSKRGRTRKIVLVAHYDTGKVTPPLVQRVQATGLPFGLISVGGMVAAALLLLIRIFAGGNIFLNVLTVIVLLVVLVPIVKAVLIHLAPYNEGANNNASGVAALLEVARRISRGSVSEADLAAGAEGVVVHGENAAMESGLVPEGAQIRYEAEQLTPPAEIGEYDEEERLLAAKAAIAAMTGKPVERKVYGSVADNLVNSRAQAYPADEVKEPVVEEAAAGIGVVEGSAVESAPQEGWAAPEPVAGGHVKVAAPQVASAEAGPSDALGFENAPSWFVSAQRNAKKPTGETGPIMRSRYTEAIETAEREVAERERRRVEQQRVLAEQQRRAREEMARAAIEAAQAEAVEAEAYSKSLEENPAPVPADVEFPATDAEQVVAVPAAAEQPVDLGSTMAHVPISMEEIRREMEQQEQEQEDSFVASPAEFSMPARRFDLPSIENEKPSVKKVEKNTNPSRSGLFRMLRSDVPSLSGVIRMQEAGEDVSQKPVVSESAVPRIETVEPAKPVEPVVVPEIDVPAIEPAADVPAVTLPEAGVDYDMDLTLGNGMEQEFQVEYGAEEQEIVAVPEYESEPTWGADLEIVEPQPRPRRSASASRSSSTRRRADRGSRQDSEESAPRGGFFSKLFHKEPEPLSETPQEWLGVEDDFEARDVGRKRGSWTSFRDDQYDDQYDDFGYDDNPAEGSAGRGERWNGGAFSRLRLGRVETKSGDVEEAVAEEVSNPVPEDAALSEEIEQIYHFRNPLFNTEIWFVAVGSDTDLHDGARALIEEHRDDLRGSMIIEIESLGVGELAVASEEGRIKKMKASSRVKRFTRQATAATGIQPGTVKLTGCDSITTTVQKAGFQAMHLLGVEDGKPALKGSADDVIENIDEMLLDENVNFLLELVKRG